MTSSFEILPPELFRSILTYLSPEDTSALSQTCHRMNIITRDEEIWKEHFFKRYTYYTRVPQYSNEEYSPGSSSKSITPPDGCTWQEYFRQRAFQDKDIRLLLNNIISNRTDRISNATHLSSTYGLLAFDVLKTYFPPSMNTSNQSLISSSRNLTREYYSVEIFRLISREIGLILLHDIKTRRDNSSQGKALLNALFIIQCFHPSGILLSLNRLHLIGQKLLCYPKFLTGNLNEKCEIIMSTMRIEQFIPANGGSEYYDVENSFLYSTFNGKPTIPLTLVSIFCALADECGLTSRPIGFPGEVMTQVDDPSNTSMPLIISVFDSKILSLTEINERLTDVLNEPLMHPLPITSIIELIIRSARNMINSITRYSTSSLSSYGLYAAVAILKILEGGVLPFAFDSMMSVLKEHFIMDIHFFQMLSSSSTINDNLNSNLPIINEKRRIDLSPKFYIGQIFQHEQYHYWGIICGWDTTCMASPLWQVRMGIANLKRGASQAFYHILANDSSRRYVAEDNINILAFNAIETDEEKYSIIEKLCATDDIGKYFERVDMNNAKFIPNIELKTEYPDDFI